MGLGLPWAAMVVVWLALRAGFVGHSSTGSRPGAGPMPERIHGPSLERTPLLTASPRTSGPGRTRPLAPGQCSRPRARWITGPRRRCWARPSRCHCGRGGVTVWQPTAASGICPTNPAVGLGHYPIGLGDTGLGLVVRTASDVPRSTGLPPAAPAPVADLDTLGFAGRRTGCG